jgi:AcrR family transcriptional regulator
VTEQRSERLPRAQRREQILAAATTAFARAGFAATSLDDVAREAGISRMIVYRHFESKRDLYEQALVRFGDRIHAATLGDEISMKTLEAFIAAAAAEPDGFRLLYRHAAREPEFRSIVDQVRQGMAEATYEQIAGRVADPAWRKWAADSIPPVLVETIMAWLDAGQPDPATVADRVQAVLRTIIEAAHQAPDPPPSR